jgi:hypothetical protein
MAAGAGIEPVREFPQACVQAAAFEIAKTAGTLPGERNARQPDTERTAMSSVFARAKLIVIGRLKSQIN